MDSLSLSTTTQPNALALLPECQRSRVGEWAMCIERIKRAMARGMTQRDAFIEEARVMCCGEGTVRTRYFRHVNALKRGGELDGNEAGALALADGRKTRAGNGCSLPAAFLKYVGNEWAKLKRSLTGFCEARRRVIGQWRQWLRTGDARFAIPGYDSPPPSAPLCDHPQGWSEEHLRKAVTKAVDPYVIEGMKVGKHAATAKYMPQLYTTRVGLLPGQVIVFDDQWWDCRVVMPGINKRSFRPVGINCLDILSGCDIAQGYKPMLDNPDGDGRLSLREEDMFWMLLQWASQSGWRADTGTVILAELGTAGITEELERRLHTVSGGKITVKRGRIDSAPLVKGLFFKGQSKGNPRFKAARESWFNLLRNVAAGLPGGVGRNKDFQPEENAAIERHDVLALRAYELLRPELAERLQFEQLTWKQFMELAPRIVRTINDRTEHKLEGWDTLNFYTDEYRVSPGSPDWISMEGLETHIKSALWARPGMTRQRRFSPLEVWTARSGMKTLTTWEFNILIPSQYARKSTVRPERIFLILDMEIDREGLQYEAKAKQKDGHHISLKIGEEYLIYLNPFSPQVVQICDLQGRCIGVTERLVKATRLNEESMVSHWARQAQARSEQGPDLNAFVRDTVERRAEMNEVNGPLLLEAGVVDKNGKAKRVSGSKVSGSKVRKSEGGRVKSESRKTAGVASAAWAEEAKGKGSAWDAL